MIFVLLPFSLSHKAVLPCVVLISEFFCVGVGACVPDTL